MALLRLPPVVLALGLAACIGKHRDEVVITDIQITGETDFGALDVEVHLFDDVTGTHLGCAGAAQGLEGVDASDVAYSVYANIEQPDGDVIYADDLEGRVLELIVIEDDVAPCPTPPGPEDDVVGLREGLDHGTLDRGPIQAFDDVVALRVAFE